MPVTEAITYMSMVVFVQSARGFINESNPLQIRIVHQRDGFMVKMVVPTTEWAKELSHVVGTGWTWQYAQRRATSIAETFEKQGVPTERAWAAS